MRSFPVVVFLLTAIAGMHGCGEDEGSSPSASNIEKTTSQSTGVADAQADLPESVSHERALNASNDVENWLLHGRTYDEQRFSPLDQITRDNIGRLGVAWLSRWNRGVAVWNGKVIVGTGDCRLVAVDAEKGTLVWEVETCDSSAGYAITGAPRVGDGKVFIGNAGADFGLRGYVTAYDADSGEQLWRFYIVPREPAPDQVTQVLEMAAETGSGEAGRQYGGGGSVWDSMTFDQELNRLYLGTDSVFPEYINITDPEEFDDLSILMSNFRCCIAQEILPGAHA